MRGYVYVLINRAMPGFIKIGMTSRSVDERVKEINSATGVPVPFRVYGVVWTYDADGLERRAHRFLRHRRVRQQREFFQVSPSFALNWLRVQVNQEAAQRRNWSVRAANGRRRAQGFTWGVLVVIGVLTATGNIQWYHAAIGGTFIAAAWHKRWW